MVTSRSGALQILGLPENASDQEIRRAHRDLAAVWHPDRFTNNELLRKRAERELKDINVARDFLLGNPEGRVEQVRDNPASAPAPPSQPASSPPQGWAIPEALSEPLGNRIALAAAVVALVGAGLPLYSLENPPSHTFYSFLRLVDPVAALAAAYALFRTKSYRPLSYALILIGAIELFAKMRRSQWVPYDWAAVVCFAFAATLLLPTKRKLTAAIAISVLIAAYCLIP